MELNAEQIKKALERCTSGAGCKDCPRELSFGGCFRQVMINALALITLQEQKIKELTEDNANLHASCTELTQECKKWQDCLKIECEYTEKITVRKMQERLHKRFKSDRDAIYTGYNIHRYIDQIAKEMLEDEK